MCTVPILLRLWDIAGVHWPDKMDKILNMEDVEEDVNGAPQKQIPQQNNSKKKNSKQEPVTPKTPPKGPSTICVCSGCTRPVNAGYGLSGMHCYRHRNRCQVPSSMPGSKKNSLPREIHWDSCDYDAECLDANRPFCGRGGICVDRRS
jgi:hypothetical protein